MASQAQCNEAYVQQLMQQAANAVANYDSDDSYDESDYSGSISGDDADDGTGHGSNNNTNEAAVLSSLKQISSSIQAIKLKLPDNRPRYGKADILHLHHALLLNYNQTVTSVPFGYDPLVSPVKENIVDDAKDTRLEILETI